MASPSHFSSLSAIVYARSSVNAWSVTWLHNCFLPPLVGGGHFSVFTCKVVCMCDLLFLSSMYVLYAMITTFRMGRLHWMWQKKINKLLWSTSVQLVSCLSLTVIVIECET